MSTLQFYCSGLNTLITANKGTLDSYNVVADADFAAQATVTVPLSTVADVFQYKVYAASTEDPEFQMVTTPANLLGIDLSANCVVDTNSITGVAARKLGYDWIEYLADEIWGNYKASDWFNNEADAINLQTAFATKFATILTARTAITDGSEASCKAIFTQIADRYPARFGTSEVPATPVPATRGNDWKRLPLVENDEICFQLQIDAHEDQRYAREPNPATAKTNYEAAKATADAMETGVAKTAALAAAELLHGTAIATRKYLLKVKLTA
jgi:hypothetical protein